MTKKEKNTGGRKAPPSGSAAEVSGNAPVPEQALAALRKKAEQQLRGREERINELSQRQAAELIHELGTHQIELEMQNEELRRLQRQLEISRRQYEDLFDFAPVGYLLLDSSHAILAANMTASGMLKVARSKLIGEFFKKYVHAQDLDAFFKHLQQLWKSRAPQSCELRLSGEAAVGWVRLDSIPVTDKNDEIVELRLALTDISDKRQIEMERERLIRELEDSVQELQGFTYSVSHDLRAPIRHLSSYAQLLEKKAGPALDEKSLGMVKIISAASKKLGILVDELLEFSRMGHTAMAKSRINLDTLVDDIIRNYKKEEKKRHIEWRLHPLPKVCGDPSMLQLILANLIDNAVKYTSRRPIAVIEIGSAEDEDNYIFYVKDNGIGFDMKYYDNLFGVFHRLHTTEEFEGTGIGLANVQRIVQRHGGRVWAVGKIEEGATFYISLPKIEKD